MPDEPLRNDDAVNISPVADMKQHVGYTGGRRFLKGRKNTPYAIDLLLHLLLVFSHHIASLLVISGRRLIWSVAGRRKPNVPELVDHVTFWVPVLVLTVTEDLDKLLKNCRLTTVALLRELGGVMVVAVDLPIVFVVAVLRAEDGRTEGAREVVDVVFSLQGRDIRPS